MSIFVQELGVVIGHNVIIEDNVTIGNNSFYIIDGYCMDFCVGNKQYEHMLTIGNNPLIRSGSVIYTESEIGANLQTGHRVTIRKKTKTGEYISIGTLTDIQGNCNI